MKIIRVARVVWDGEAAITDGHLAFTEGQSEEADFVQQAAQRLEKTPTHQTQTRDINKHKHKQDRRG